MFNNLPPVVKNLLIINVLLWLATIMFDKSMGINLTLILGGFYPGSPDFMPWQIVSHMFMHAAVTPNGGVIFMHIFFNMFALFMFGTTLERYWGPKRFLIYYMVTGLGAFFLHHFVNGFQVYQAVGTFFPDPQLVLQTRDPGVINAFFVPAVGASGAVFGILLAFGMLFPNTRLMLLFPPIPIKAKYFVMIYGALELYLGLSNNLSDNVAHFAHLGGMLFGYLLLKYWQNSRTHFY